MKFMRQTILTLLALLIAITASAQSADKLYAEGKAQYDAKNYAQAFPKLKDAAEKGHPKAQYRLGRCYAKGLGTDGDASKAFLWYTKSAAQDFAKAQYQLGKCYKNGDGVEKSATKAFEYFTKAAKQDNADAQLALGKCYLRGRGVAADAAKAKTWFNRAVKNEKGGKKILEELRKDAADGNEKAKEILALIKK